MERGQVRIMDLRVTAIAVAALAVGVAIYVLDRPPGSAYLLPRGATLFSGTALWFGGAGDWIPAFLHVFAFSLLSAALLRASRAAAASACVAWWAIDSLFELGQHPAISPHLGAAYFVRGSFDPADLLATALGAVFAYATLILIRRRAMP
jgi:hypothetical protein